MQDLCLKDCRAVISIAVFILLLLPSVAFTQAGTPIGNENTNLYCYRTEEARALITKIGKDQEQKQISPKKARRDLVKRRGKVRRLQKSGKKVEAALVQGPEVAIAEQALTGKNLTRMNNYFRQAQNLGFQPSKRPIGAKETMIQNLEGYIELTRKASEDLETTKNPGKLIKECKEQQCPRARGALPQACCRTVTIPASFYFEARNFVGSPNRCTAPGFIMWSDADSQGASTVTINFKLGPNEHSQVVQAPFNDVVRYEPEGSYAEFIVPEGNHWALVATGGKFVPAVVVADCSDFIIGYENAFSNPSVSVEICG